MLNMFLQLQNADGSFPRKFRDDFSIVDKSGGSTPSATLPLVMGYKYFKINVTWIVLSGLRIIWKKN